MPSRVAINGFGRIGRACCVRPTSAKPTWYDNEWGYANRLVELAGLVVAPVPVGG